MDLANNKKLGKINMGNYLKKSLRIEEIGSIAAIMVMIIILSIMSEHFLTAGNLLNVARQMSILAIISVGMNCVIISGEFDLSVGSTYGLTAVAVGTALVAGVKPVIAFLFGILLSSLVGVVNGLLVTKVGIPAFVATMGMMSIGRGIAQTSTGGWPVSIYGIKGMGDWFLYLGGGLLFGVIPMQAIVMVFVVFLGYLLLHKSSVGYHIFAVGGNSRAATLYGISVDRVKIFAFALTGLLSGLAGMLALSFIQTAEPNLGMMLELDVVAACVIGGASLRGGRGSILGCFLGAVTIGILRNGLVLMGVSPFVQRIVIGVVIVGAVALSEMILKVRSK